MIKENNDKLLIFLLFQLESFTIFLRTSEQHVHRLTSRDTVLYPVQGTGSKNKIGGRVSISHIYIKYRIYYDFSISLKYDYYFKF